FPFPSSTSFTSSVYPSNWLRSLPVFVYALITTSSFVFTSPLFTPQMVPSPLLITQCPFHPPGPDSSIHMCRMNPFGMVGSTHWSVNGVPRGHTSSPSPNSSFRAVSPVGPEFCMNQRNEITPDLSSHASTPR